MVAGATEKCIHTYSYYQIHFRPITVITGPLYYVGAIGTLAALMNNTQNFNSSTVFYNIIRLRTCWPPTRNIRLLEGLLKQVNSNENKGEFNWREAFSFIINKKIYSRVNASTPAL